MSDDKLIIRVVVGFDNPLFDRDRDQLRRTVTDALRVAGFRGQLVEGLNSWPPSGDEAAAQSSVALDGGDAREELVLTVKPFEPDPIEAVFPTGEVFEWQLDLGIPRSDAIAQGVSEIYREWRRRASTASLEGSAAALESLTTTLLRCLNDENSRLRRELDAANVHIEALEAQLSASSWMVRLGLANRSPQWIRTGAASIGLVLAAVAGHPIGSAILSGTTETAISTRLSTDPTVEQAHQAACTIAAGGNVIVIASPPPP